MTDKVFLSEPKSSAHDWYEHVMSIVHIDMRHKQFTEYR